MPRTESTPHRASAAAASRHEGADELQARLRGVLAQHGDLAIAVSGGIDSMTLAFIAHRDLEKPPAMVHAVSPAVPAEATERVRDYAAREHWMLSVVDAGEFADPAYRSNPVDRCYFCKSNLYSRIAGLSPRTIASGTNLDDLGDFRPGLKAAQERRVVHPFVEAHIGKAGIRALARLHSLTDIAELPAQPCLASRVETGIGIDADDLAFIDATERFFREQVAIGTDVRCRLTQQGIVLEIGAPGDVDLQAIAMRGADLCRQAGRQLAAVRPYRRGSAFLRTSSRRDDHAGRN
jgi:pyridinium-3,5-biscarboxylic acid mononucleotide sulfurtransferase